MRPAGCILQLIALLVVDVYGDEPDRIVGGKPTTIEDYPHVISLRYYGQHICGGSIISPKIVITAAHCTTSPYENSIRPANSFTVVTGTTFLNRGGQHHTVEKIWRHEMYDPRLLENDISLIKVATPISFGPGQQPIRLPTEDIAMNDTVTIVGWGSQSSLGPIDNNLRKFEAEIMFPDECQKYLFQRIYRDQFCTLIRTHGSCNYDGSGLINSNGEIAGLVSGGRPCEKDMPDIHTNIYYHLSWINQKMSL